MIRLMLDQILPNSAPSSHTANMPSVKLARKLGYRSEREYPLWAWFKS